MSGHGAMTSQREQGQIIFFFARNAGLLHIKRRYRPRRGSFDHFRSELTWLTPPQCPSTFWSMAGFCQGSFFSQKYVTQKDENSTIEFPVKFCIETMLFVTKITALKFSPFFTGISQIHVLKFKLSLTSHLTYF